MTSAANAASPSSYATEGVTDETLWTDPDDPTLIPYRRAKTLAERAAWDFMAGHTGPTELTTVLPGAVFGPVLTAATTGSVGIVARMVSGAMAGIPRIGLEEYGAGERPGAGGRESVGAGPRSPVRDRCTGAGARWSEAGERSWLIPPCRAADRARGPVPRRRGGRRAIRTPGSRR